ncbi:MAG: winged helix-turn-helix domain-containing protein, partial [Verrucomicrobiota bacterium]|nr:winged helix-turn-helix domain-containing protein [Verrucomicrobiota bacterium]
VFETLLYLVQHPGAVLDKEQLMEAVWPDAVVEENKLSQNISTLRRVFGESRGSHRYIVTVPGRGYRFVAEVTSGEKGAAAETTDAPAHPSERKAIDSTIAAERGATRRWLRPVAILVLVFVVVAAFYARHQLRPAAAPQPPVLVKSIAVLPFENLSPEPENAYFASGINDEILARLSRIANLKVISRSSTEGYKAAFGSLHQIAQQLGVAYALEGSVQRAGDRVRVAIQLINAQTDATLWTESYDRQLTDIFQVETEVAERVAAELAATLSVPEERALNARPTTDMAAHQEYLMGRYFWNKRTVEGYQQAIDHFNRAIEMDPRYAQAYVGLADAFLFLGGDNVPGQKELLSKGRAALVKALELDETLAEAHASLGLQAMLFEWDWRTAEKELRRAIQLDPNYATAHQWLGELLADLGQTDEGVREIRRAYELDPLSLIIGTDVGKVYTVARSYDAAIEQYENVLQMDPKFAQARGLLALTLSLSSRHEEAVAEMQKLEAVESNAMYLAWRGYVFGRAGRKTEADEALQHLEDLSRQTYVSPLWMAFIFTGLGDKDAAFRWFDKVFEEHAAGGAISLKVNPIFDDFRADPRLGDLLRRANLTQ